MLGPRLEQWSAYDRCMSNTRTDDRSPLPERTAGLAAGLGAWILWSGVILTGSGWIVINNVISGAAIAVFASYAAAVPGGGRLPSVAAPLLTALVGLWVVAAPFVLWVTLDRIFWSNVIAGVLVVLLAIGSVVGAVRMRRSSASGV